MSQKKLRAVDNDLLIMITRDEKNSYAMILSFYLHTLVPLQVCLSLRLSASFHYHPQTRTTRRRIIKPRESNRRKTDRAAAFSRHFYSLVAMLTSDYKRNMCSRLICVWCMPKEIEQRIVEML